MIVFLFRRNRISFHAGLTRESGCSLTIREYAGFHRIAPFHKTLAPDYFTTGERNFEKKRNAETRQKFLAFIFDCEPGIAGF
jgi:hypothetical protein